MNNGWAGGYRFVRSLQLQDYESLVSAGGSCWCCKVFLSNCLRHVDPTNWTHLTASAYSGLGGVQTVCLFSRWAYLDRLLCVWLLVVGGVNPLPLRPEGGLLDSLGRLPGVTNSVRRLAPILPQSGRNQGFHKYFSGQRGILTKVTLL